MRTSSFLFMVLLLLCLLSPVSATTISFSNPTDLAERDLLMYFPNGTYIATYNLTSDVLLPDDTDVYFVAKAHVVNPLTDPGDWMQGTLDYFTTNVTGLIIGFSLIAMLGSAIFRKR